MNEVSQLKALLEERCPGLEVREGESMARHTTFRIGGPAALMALPRSREEAVRAVGCARQVGVEPFFLGNGSNLLVSDQGYDGFVLKTQPGLGSLTVEGNRITAGSGALLSRASALAWERGLTGLEFAQGIPGSIGGGLMMNAGAYGGEMAGVLSSVTVLGEDGEKRVLSREECNLSYRHSVFMDHPGWLILECELTLQEGDREEIGAKMAQLAERRRSKQPLEFPSAGSAFKRPQGAFAAALIEECGLKGFRVGDAQVSEKHAGFLVNRGSATCGEMLAVMERVRETVLREKGIALESEIRLLGI